MQSLQKVIVSIDKKSGKMTVEADGFIGNSCDEIAQIEAQLGAVTATNDKPERYMQVQPDFVPVNI